ncbi:M48 family metalloprotease [Flaviflagellibacter deserti]|uniref:M48 family metalloprotease n=1 Tax=Flaviflagellibacter deserti TaxID=2267266 RepID=A0ABV9Z359_9HYPH
MLAFGTTSLSAPSAAQGANNRLAPVRDAEIEELMRDYVTPVLKAAGQEPSAIQIHLVRDMSFNAFVANGRRIFINLGAIVDAKTPNQLIGVLAHETGHIAGGHLSAMRQKLEEAQTRAIIAMLLGAAAVGAGAASGASGSTIAGGAQAAVTAPGEIIKRDLLSYIRSQEQAADQAAVSYLTKTGQSPKGMLEVFKGFADKSMFNARFVDPYAQTHPMPVERIALLERIANESPYLNAQDSDELLKRHKMVQAKIIGFVRPMDTVLRTYPLSNTSLPARYARAVATYRFGSVEVAQREIDSLISTEPNNPYFWELKGQALLEAGRPKQAIEPLRRASSLKPRSGLIRIMLGEAMVASNDNSQLDAAITQLRQATASEQESADAYRNLANAYGRKNQLPEADLASAQAAFYSGDVQTAKELAARAKQRFSAGSPGWLRADDIVNYRAPKLK